MVERNGGEAASVTRRPTCRQAKSPTDLDFAVRVARPVAFEALARTNRSCDVAIREIKLVVTSRPTPRSGHMDACKWGRHVLDEMAIDSVHQSYLGAGPNPLVVVHDLSLTRLDLDQLRPGGWHPTEFISHHNSYQIPQMPLSVSLLSSTLLIS
jgi:hypothetical protein